MDTASKNLLTAFKVLGAVGVLALAFVNYIWSLTIVVALVLGYFVSRGLWGRFWLTLLAFLGVLVVLATL